MLSTLKNSSLLPRLCLLALLVPGAASLSACDDTKDSGGESVAQDLDSDGVVDSLDNCVDEPNTDQIDGDEDGEGDVCDGFPTDPLNDRDDDGAAGPDDNCDGVANADQADADEDGLGDACEPDSDGDTVIDDLDNCIRTPNTDQADGDDDTVGDACEPDSDDDGIVDDDDNCVRTPNADQADDDDDTVGDACEGDADADGIVDDADNCVRTPNADQGDADDDGLGDACEPDADDDGVADDLDNCRVDANGTQEDADNDGIGDSCDNCVETPNFNQADSDGDGEGDACEVVPCADGDEDGACDEDDACPEDPAKSDSTGQCGCGVADTDTDEDGTADCNDGCAEDGGKIEEGQCGCGSVDVDSDEDGIADCNDDCPEDPGKIEEGVCGCGTPDADTDRDTLLDCEDNCPFAANRLQGDLDDDGFGDACDSCPDDAEEVQSDVDEDGVGDVCDICPDTSNPRQDGWTDDDGVCYFCDDAEFDELCAFAQGVDSFVIDEETGRATFYLDGVLSIQSALMVLDIRDYKQEFSGVRTFPLDIDDLELSFDFFEVVRSGIEVRGGYIAITDACGEVYNVELDEFGAINYGEGYEYYFNAICRTCPIGEWESVDEGCLSCEDVSFDPYCALPEGASASWDEATRELTLHFQGELQLAYVELCYEFYPGGDIGSEYSCVVGIVDGFDAVFQVPPFDEPGGYFTLNEVYPNDVCNNDWYVPVYQNIAVVSDSETGDEQLFDDYTCGVVDRNGR